MKDEKQNKKNKTYSLKYFILSFLILFLISFAVLFTIEKQVRTAKFEEIKANEIRIVDFENDFIVERFSMILADLHYLHHAFREDLENPASHQRVASNWMSFSSQRNIYDQIRYIDLAGDEIIRINLGEDGGYIVPEGDLQNKRDRYYFYETLELERETVHISQMDLNIEFDKIEVPYKPMVRFSTTTHDSEENLTGIIVLNFLAEDVLHSFRELALNSMGEVSLLNSESFWLSSTNPDLEWNFMFEDLKDKTFQNKYKEEWEEIRNKDGQIISPKGLFTFSKVSLENNARHKDKAYDEDIYLKDGDWYIVSVLERDGEYGHLFIDNNLDLILDIIRDNKLYIILIFLVAGISSYLIYLNRKTYSKIKYYSEFDALTGVYNRRAGISRLSHLFPADDRRSFTVSLCFIDVNGLKEVNDILGHKRGDELLKTVVDVIKSTLREDDFIVRMGGDEFLIVFNGIDTERAEKVWLRIKDKYDKINSIENRPYLVSVSHGIVSNKDSQKSQIDNLIKMADEKMYEEKRTVKKGLEVIR